MNTITRIGLMLLIGSGGTAFSDPFIDLDAPVLTVCGNSASPAAYAKTQTERAVEDLNARLLVDKTGVSVVVGTPMAKILRPFKISPVTISSEGSVTLACVTLSKG